MAIYATYLTNKFGFLLKNAKTKEKQMLLREEYTKTLFKKLKLKVNVINKEKLPQDGKYLLISNHRSIFILKILCFNFHLFVLLDCIVFDYYTTV